MNGWIPVDHLNWGYSNIFFFLKIKKKLAARFLACGILGPWLATEPAPPLQWTHGVLTTDCQGSPEDFAFQSIPAMSQKLQGPRPGTLHFDMPCRWFRWTPNLENHFSGARERIVTELWQCVGVLWMLMCVQPMNPYRSWRGEYYPHFTVEKPSSWILWNTPEATQLVTHGTERGTQIYSYKEKYSFW